MIAEYPWGRYYEKAILETNRSKLASHIRVAEQAIMARAEELNSDHGGGEEERAAIRDALSGLRILRRELVQSVSEGNLERGSSGDTPPPSNTGSGWRE
ncbi:MAG: hypothetical protein WB762_02630 [Candidatus Sulfotelmatobacter sp.]